MIEKLTLNDLRYIVEQATKELLKESYGISELVSSEASYAAETIREHIDAGYTCTDIHETEHGDVMQHSIFFERELFGELNINFECTVFVANNIQAMSEFKKTLDKTSLYSYFDKKNKIVLNKLLCVPTNNFSLGKNIQIQIQNVLAHEIHHVYEWYLKREFFSKEGNKFTKKDILYTKAINVISNSDGLEKDIALCIYHSYKNEQTAILQQLVKELLVKDYNNNVWEIVKQTEYYKTFEMLKTLKTRVFSKSNEVDEYLKDNYNKDIQWLYKLIEKTIKEMRRIINRAVWRVVSHYSPKKDLF